jgi:hypothetical protein
MKSIPKRCEALIQANTKCNKKLKLLNTFECKCGLFFCNVHRYASEHACAFDYKTVNKERIAADNPKIIAIKLKKI